MIELLISSVLFIILYSYLKMVGLLLQKWAPGDPKRKSPKWALLDICNVTVFATSGFGPVLIIGDLNEGLYLVLLIIVLASNIYIFHKKYKHLKPPQHMYK